MSCINKRTCQLCRNLAISASITIVTVDGTDTLVIDIPAGVYANGSKVCLVTAQVIPTTATIATPVAISIGGDTTTVYPVIGCNGNQVTAPEIRSRRKYPLRVSTSATSGVFRSLGGLLGAQGSVLDSIPVAAPATETTG